MKTRLQIGLLGVVLMLSGCATAGKFFSFVGDWAVGVYKATTRQVAVADQRADAAYEKMPAAEKQALKEKGVRYLAVRTDDPTPEQMVQIRRNAAAKPSGPYGGTPAAAAPKKVYCVMVWDTQTREVVGTDCYATFKLPQPGEQAQFDTYTTQYVGTF